MVDGIMFPPEAEKAHRLPGGEGVPTGHRRIYVEDRKGAVSEAETKDDGDGIDLGTEVFGIAGEEFNE